MVMLGRDFDALFRELYVPAYAVALRILGDRQDAEDAAAEAMARTVASWRRLQGVDYQRAWVLRVTANVSVDMIRRCRTVSSESVDGGDEVARPVSSVERVALADALAKLPRRQREVVVLRYLADMTEVQVAEHLQISKGSVKQHSRRALAALRADLDEGVPGVSYAF